MQAPLSTRLANGIRKKNEIIVDNDTPNASLYLEVGSKKAKWDRASVRGFAQKKTIYQDGGKSFRRRYLPNDLHRKKEKEEQGPSFLPNGYLPCRQPEHTLFMFLIRHYPTA